MQFRYPLHLRKMVAMIFKLMVKFFFNIFRMMHDENFSLYIMKLTGVLDMSTKFTKH